MRNGQRQLEMEVEAAILDLGATDIWSKKVEVLSKYDLCSFQA
jgi:hypothetical protein